MALLNKGPLYSVVYSKCSRCNLGNLYENNNPYYLPKMGQMKKKCDCCGQKFEPETGFYYGAMYVSYALTILFTFIPAGIMYIYFDASSAVLISTVIGINVILWPISFRWARNIWLNIFVHYQPEMRKKIESEKAV
jgi:hypothetical protein